MTVDPNLRYVSPLEGTGLAIFAVTIACGVLSTLVVALRIYVRLLEQAFGWDDGLMMSGLTVYLVEVGLACNGARSGLGALDVKLNKTMSIEAKKYLMIWMLLYVVSLVIVKSSICVTMLRIGSTVKLIRVAIHTLLVWAILTFIATFIGILCLCRPVEANWNTALVLEGKATCSSMDAMIGLSYFSTASSIATDMAIAGLPAILLWNMQLKRVTKIFACVLLSFGSFASISTMIRTPYIRYYRNPTDNLPYHIGNIILWSNIETAIGLVAGSLPTLRRVVKRARATSKPSISNPNSIPFGTPGPSRSKNKNRDFKNPTDLGVSIATVHTVRGDGDWRKLQDEGFETFGTSKQGHGGIRTDYTYEVELTRDPEYQSLGSR